MRPLPWLRPTAVVRWSGKVVETVVGELAGPSRRPRRVWRRSGVAHIELRGRARVGVCGHAAVTAALRGLEGVDWAEVDEAIGRVLVSFDEQVVDLANVVAVIEETEAELHATDGDPADGVGGSDRPTEQGYPADGEPLVAEVIALGVEVGALGIAVVGRLTRLPVLPRASGALLALVDHQPQVRAALVGRLGATGTDLVLGLATAGVGALTRSPDLVATSVVARLARLGELRAATAVFARREPELTHATRHAADTRSAWPGELSTVATVRRARPLPAGPVERVCERLALAGLAAGSLSLAASRSPTQAGQIIMALAPRPARLGREVFAAAATRRLAARGIVVLDGSCLRRLDRVDTVVVSAPVLLGDACRVLAASDADAWTRIDALLEGTCPRHRFRPGEPIAIGGIDRLVAAHPAGLRAAADSAGLPVALVRAGSRVTGLVGAELDGHAEAVLRAARGCGRLLMTAHASTADVAGFIDTEIATEPVDGLAAQIGRLQAEGAIVLAVADGDPDALFRADVGVGRLRPATRPPWSADLVGGPELADVWRVLQLPPAARLASRRSATLAVSASTLATLTSIAGGRRPANRWVALAGGPVTAAAMLSMISGAMAAVRADRHDLPVSARHADWHALSTETVQRRLDAAPRQLSLPDGEPSQPVSVRDGLAGQMAGRADRGIGGVRRLVAAVVADLHDPLIPVLMVGAAASAVLGSSVDAALVAGVSFTNALLSGAQRARAETALRGLVGHHIPLARLVTTDGTALVPADQLAVGDLVDIHAADVVPADARLVTADALEVDEATMTGESIPVTKDTDPAPVADFADRRCMLYEGTTVLAGSGRAVVVATGPATVAGRAALATVGCGAPVGVQAQLADLTRVALPLTGLCGLAVAGLGWLRGSSARTAVGSGVAVAVAAVPEGLPLVATVAQAAAARRLARQGVMVRSSRVVEALGRTDVVCFDKTGTLTEGRLVLREVAVPDDDRWCRLPPQAPNTANLLRLAAAACPSPDGTVVHATDRAVLAAASSPPLGDRLAEMPFETSRGYAATLLRAENGTVLAVKGAPEVLLDRCHLTEPARHAAREAAERLACDGLRVLAVAHVARPAAATTIPLPRNGNQAIPDSDVNGLLLAGFVGLADTLRPTAADAVTRLTDAGLRVLVVTGDHPTTASVIAQEVGVPAAHTVVTGTDLQHLSEDDYTRRISSAAVFARMSPEQKVRLVAALQHAGHVVAMTGDGTNDAAAIRTADVGVAVQHRGSAAATGAADLLLTDADITRLADAVLAGRHMWQAVTDAISVLVGGNAGEIAFTLAGTALAGTAPLSPRQLLLVNLMTDMAPAMALAVRDRSPAQPDASRCPAPEGGRKVGLDEARPSAAAGALRRTVIVRGLTTALGATAAWTLGRFTGTPRRASTIGLLALVGTQLGQTLTLAGPDRLVMLTAFGSAALLAAVVQTPVISSLFDCRPIGPLGWTTALTCATAATLTAWAYERLHSTRPDTHRRTAHPLDAHPAPTQRGHHHDDPRSSPVDSTPPSAPPRNVPPIPSPPGEPASL